MCVHRSSVKGAFVFGLQVGVLGGSRLRQQRSWIWVWPLVSAESCYDGRQHLLHLHGGGSGVHLQPPSST